MPGLMVAATPMMKARILSIAFLRVSGVFIAIRVDHHQQEVTRGRRSEAQGMA